MCGRVVGIQHGGWKVARTGASLNSLLDFSALTTS